MGQKMQNNVLGVKGGVINFGTSRYHNPETGERLSTAKDHHGDSCKSDPAFASEFCPGGHNPHCARV